MDPVIVEHLPGRHDQKTHGNWARKRGGGYRVAKHTSVDDWLDKGDVIGEYDRSGPGDLNLLNIWKEQGFDGRPRVVDDDGLDAEVKAGGLEVWRGIGNDERGDEGTVWAREFIEADEPYPGFGQYGNGTYATPSEELATRYTGSLLYSGGGLLRMVLRKDARVIAYEDLVSQMWQARDQVMGDPRLEEAVRDWGRLASMLGYDAMTVGVRRGGPPDEVVILNRTAVSVSSNVRTV
jgi:hypothetical protein